MEANEAPEKLYVHVKKGKALNIWNSEWVGVNDIEYIRTDAFIEKAVKYVASRFLAPGMDNEINDFVNYMKGE